MKWLQATADVVPYTIDSRFTPEMLWSKVKGICPQEREKEVKQKISEGITLGQPMQYVMALREDKK